MKLTLLYFAQFQQQAQKASEVLEAADSDLRHVYAMLQQRYGFRFQIEHVRVACNDALVQWNHVPRDGDVIAFLPPFSGG
jgi:molybdopterin converting factor small subunit